MVAWHLDKTDTIGSPLETADLLQSTQNKKCPHGESFATRPQRTAMKHCISLALISAFLALRFNVANDKSLTLSRWHILL